MPKSRKQKASVGKRTTTKKRKSRINTADEAVLTAFEMLPPQSRNNTARSEVKLEDFADVSEERSSIISIVKGLEGQVETAFKLKEILEIELNATQKKLSEELDARTQLEVQVNSLEAQVALAEQLREDISFAEEERNKFATLLAQTQPQLEEVLAERDLLTDSVASAEAYTKELEDEKIAFEAQVINLRDKISDAEQVRGELTEMTEANQNMHEQLCDLKRNLKTSTASKDTLGKELAGAHQTSQGLREEIENLRRKVAGTNSLAADLRIQLEEQQATNKELMEIKARLENEIKMLKINCEAARNELNTFKNALRDIRNEATRTSGRVHQRYFKPNLKGGQSKKVPLSTKV